MRLKIISDGVVAERVHVVNADTDEELQHVRKVTWVCKAGGMATATIEVLGAQIDAQCLADVVVPGSMPEGLQEGDSDTVRTLV